MRRKAVLTALCIQAPLESAGGILEQCLIGVQPEQGTLPVCVMLLMDEEEGTRILEVLQEKEDLCNYFGNFFI